MKSKGRAAGAAILVMAKAPVPGRVKTRLIGALTSEQAAALHLACIHDTLRLAHSVRGARKYLFLAGTTRAVQDAMRKLKPIANWHLAAQSKGDLGARLAHAIRRAMRDGAACVVVIGTDTPWMGAARIRDAIRGLTEHDIVLGPCRDGGYYLLAVRRFVPEILAGIDWGTGRVLQQTLRAAKHRGASVGLLALDFDLDRPADLARTRRLCRRREWTNTELGHWLKLNPPKRQSSRRQQPHRRSKTRRLGRA